MKNTKQFLKVVILFSTMVTVSSQILLAQKINKPIMNNVKTLTLKELQKEFNKKWERYNVKNGYYFENGERKKAPGWNQFKRFEWYWEARVNPQTGEFPQTNAAAEYERVKNVLKKETAYNENWTNLGVNSSAGGYHGIGRINCIEFHPSDANTFWVGSPAGGIWRTTDGGNTWTILNNNETVLGVSDIAITSDYATSNTLYIATGDRDEGSISELNGGQAADNVSVGVYKSTNGGSTWTATGLTFAKSSGTRIMSLLIDPNNNNNLYASVVSNNPDLTGFWKSTNGGVNWTRKITNKIGDMEFKPGTSTTIWAVSIEESGGNFYYSTDSGENWAGAQVTASGYRLEMAVTAAAPSTIYVVSSKNDSKFGGVYKSTNNGTTWTRIDNQTKYLFGYDADGSDDAGQGTYDITIAVDPTNANIVFVGGVNTWKSTDGGVTWNCKTHWSGATGIQTVHADKHAHEFQPGTNVLFEGNDGGIYKSTDAGTTWIDLTNGMVISQLYRIGVSQTEATTTIAGLQDNGTKLFRNSTWTDPAGGDGMECIVDYTDAKYMYSTYTQGQIYRSEDYGATFPTKISENIAGGQPTGAWVTPYSLDPATSSTLIAGYDKVWKTTDRGNTWTSISSVLSSTEKLRSLTIAPSDPNTIYVADKTHLWKTTNGGTQWYDHTSVLPFNGASITYIAVKKNDPNTVWITYGGYTDGKKVYQSTDGGTTWTNISTGLPNLPVMCIIQYKRATDRDVLFVGTDLGVYVKDGSANWAQYNTGLPNVVVSELDIYYAPPAPGINGTNASTDKLRAATFGRGLWETNIDAVLPVELTTFKAKVVQNDKVKLNWETATEVNNYGFEIERQSIKTQIDYVEKSNLSNDAWESVAFINGHGNSNSPKLYSYVDNYLGEGTKFVYRLKQIDIDGTFAYSDMVEVEILPNKFELKQNFPNPFNPSTKISYSLPERANVSLVITNALGQEVARLVNETKDAGLHEVVFDASNYSTGIYYYTLRAGDYVQTRKMLLIK